MSVRWRPIAGFENYLISTEGRIYNVKNKKFKTPQADPKGYMRVRLLRGSFGITKKVHRLVARAFLPNYSEQLQVNHLDCVKSNNRLENLEMCDQSKNSKHAWANGRMKPTKKGPDGRFTKK